MKLIPRYSDSYRKRMDLPPTYIPDTGFESVKAAEAELEAQEREKEAKMRGKVGGGVNEDEQRFGSLTELKWGEFESGGFGATATDKRLQFDLNEGARNVSSMVIFPQRLFITL